MAGEEITRSAESYSMNGGDRSVNYADNSKFQKTAVDATQGLVKEAIADNFDIKNFDHSNKFQIADLGCSVGPNTFIAVRNIIEAIESKYKTKCPESQIPEFQVFFNDHVNNDFNLLFKSLPPSRQYFAAGVPGSFHNRLFPKATIHFAHSSSSLNWLSRTPKEVTDCNSPAWNKGKIYCTGTEKEAAAAFSGQYKRDIEGFLSARAEELVGGGLMVLLLGGLVKDEPPCQTSIGKMYGLLGSCLLDMAKQGLISEEKVDSFNLPIYYPSVKEWEEAIERNGCFSIKKLDAASRGFMQRLVKNAQMCALHLRAGLEGLVESHFGKEIIDELFERYCKKHEENLSIFDIGDNFGLMAIVLKRNGTD